MDLNIKVGKILYGGTLYCLVNIKEKVVCLTCNESVSAMKKYNLKRHHDTKHASKINAMQGQMCEDNVYYLKMKLHNQQFLFTKPNIESDSSVRVSYILAEKISLQSKPFTDGGIY